MTNKKTYSVFDLPKKYILVESDSIFDSLKSYEQDEITTSTVNKNVIGGCIACKIEKFNDRESRMSHFQSALHVENLRRRMKGLEPLNADARIDIDADDDNDTINTNITNINNENANDSEDDDQDQDDTIIEVSGMLEITGGKVNQVIHKSFGPRLRFIIDKDNNNDDDDDDNWELLISRSIFPIQMESWNPWKALIAPQLSPKWLIILMKSGRFAVAIFDGNEVIRHKTKTRYTVRAKSGGSQSRSDSSGSKAQSAGATLRRYGETALKQDMWNVLNEFLSEIEQCGLIICSISKNMRSIVFNSPESPLDGETERVRWTPFQVRRPTFEEVKRVHREVSTIHIRPRREIEIHEEEEEEEEEEKNFKTSAASAITESPSKCTPTFPEDSLFSHKILKELLDLCKNIPQEDDNIDIVTLDKYLTDFEECTGLELEDKELLLNTIIEIDNASTPLHVATDAGNSFAIYVLLQHGANPNSRDMHRRAPYALAKDKSTRDAFRRARAVVGETRWEWDQAGVPEAMNASKEEERKEKEREKKRRARQRKKESAARDKAAAEALKKRQEDETIEFQKLKEEMANDVNYQCRECKRPLGRVTTDTKPCCSDSCFKIYRRRMMAEAAERRYGGK